MECSLKKGPEMAGSADLVPLPAHWDKWLSAAYLRMLGATQQQAAKTVGIGERTLRRWEADDLWGRACDQARGRWLHGMEMCARGALLDALRDDSDSVRRGFLALKILERLDPDFAPPRRR